MLQPIEKLEEDRFQNCLPLNNNCTKGSTSMSNNVN